MDARIKIISAIEALESSTYYKLTRLSHSALIWVIPCPSVMCIIDVIGVVSLKHLTILELPNY